MTWKKLFALQGKIETVEAFSAALIAKTGEDMFRLKNQAAFDSMVKDGWITYDDNQTIVWQDGI